IDKYAQRDLKKGLHLYGTDGNIGLTNAWSIIQTDFRCCGVSNYTDWFEVYNTTRVPDSCCLEFSESCGLHSPGTWWKAHLPECAQNEIRKQENKTLQYKTILPSFMLPIQEIAHTTSSAQW
ncbi:hypothetical protein Chor_016351, partial [Crotalus horridus]